MYQKSQSSVVSHTLLNLYYKNQKKKLADEYPLVVALLSYHIIGVEEGFASLRRLKQENTRIQLWSDDIAEKYYRKDQIIERTAIDDWILSDQEAEMKKNDCQYLFVPILSFSLLSAIIRYDDRHPFVRFILWALFAGVKVGTLSIGANPMHASWKKNRLNQGSMYLKQDIQQQFQQLRNMGVEELEVDQVSEWIQTKHSHKKQVLTEEDINEAFIKNQSAIDVPSGTIVTDLAKEMSQKRNIELVFEC